MKKYFALALSLVMLLSVAFSAMSANAATLRTLASFVYTGGVAETDVAGDKNEGYDFSSVLPGVNAKLFASVSGNSNRKLEWTDAPYAYGLGEEVMPCMTGGNKNPWGEAPYFLVRLSTKNYSDITFSAKLGGSKKGPADYKLQYSLNGRDFHDVYGASYTVTGKVMKFAFKNVPIPELNDADTAYIRIIAASTRCVDSSNPAFPGTTGGETAINDIEIAGVSMYDDSTVPPILSVADDAVLYTDDTVAITDLNADNAIVNYTLTTPAGEKVTGKYTAPFAPFALVPAGTRQVTVTASTMVGGKTSEPVEATYIWGGDQLTAFSVTEAPANTNGKVAAKSGVYAEISSLSASANGKETFVPLFDKDGGFAISPDDGIYWGKGYWLMETSTAGYSELTLSADMSSTNKGPAAFDLQYSLDGVKFTTVESSYAVGEGAQFTHYQLPEAACNQAKVYIRLLISGDQRVDGEPLYNNESLGNTYLNNLVLAGKQSGDKMPYTTAGDFVAAGEKIKLIAPEGKEITYSVTDAAGEKVIDNVTYSAPFTLTADAKAYTLTAQCGDSPVYIKQIKVSDGVLAQFAYTEDNFDTFLNAQTGVLSAQDNKGTLVMYANGVDQTVPSFEEQYGVKISASAENTWAFGGTAGKVEGNGYWLLTFSTKGYKDVNLTATMNSSVKAPRDYALAYSLDGENYTYIADSGVRNTVSQNENYSSFALSADVNDRETVYLKIFVNGGETVEMKEFAETAGSGHTGMNNITISGRAIRDGEADEPVYIPGDVDKSGTVDVADIMKLKSLIMADQWTEEELMIGDMNESDALDVGDIMAVKNVIMSA